jgi:murein DD-endopeptidase MepM/ murein hydrolase activator NlpD
MKRVALTSLFLLLFNTNSPNSTILADDYSKELELQSKIDKNKLVDKISYAIEKNEKIGLIWSDNLPIYSPLNIENIKKISDYYGFRPNHPILHIPTFHFGMDFDAEIGDNVFSTANGIVEKVDTIKYGYGNNIIINHGYGYKTRYAHLDEIFVKEGDFIKLNDVIGTVGSTGLSTGPHLHYEIIFNDKPIDPMSLLIENPSKNKGSDYFRLLVDIENTQKQLLDNNISSWKQTGVFKSNQI